MATNFDSEKFIWFLWDFVGFGDSLPTDYNQLSAAITKLGNLQYPDGPHNECVIDVITGLLYSRGGLK